MGDYKKLIVSCNVKSKIKEELEKKIEDLGLLTSAYHSQERIVDIKLNPWIDGGLNVIIVGQTKWGRGQDEFCEWLKPYVIQGSGPSEVFAISFSEYSDNPKFYRLMESNE